MNISHDWLVRFVPHGRSAAQVAELLTAHTATVEGVERLRADLATFVIARVVESEKVPDTKLSFNKVDDGSGTLLEVVCGAPNVTVGTLYPFARTGTVMPGGLTIEKRKIRGFTSNGMLCSARELGLGDDHEGILPLETDAAPGTPLLDVMPVGDVRLVVDVLPNRPDLLSHLGVARELQAITGAKLQPPAELADLPPVPAPAATGAAEASADGLTVRIEDADGCARFTAAVITGVTVCPSPAWLKACVEAVGGRSINNVVDATNYLLHGFGQPMHAYDRAKLAGGALVVRRARAGEKLVTLDGTERALTPEMMVIADAEHATGLAGVMGGLASEVTDATTEIVLEVATFDKRRVRATRRAVGTSSDASYRFERGIDDAAVPDMLSLGAALLAHVSGGHVSTVVHVGSAPAPRAAVQVRPARVERLLGDRVAADEITRLLKSVGFTVVPEGDALLVTAPSWRHDVSREVDLIEEVARLRGLDRLPDALRAARPGTVPDHPLHTASRRVRDALVAAGLMEVRPLPFTSGVAAGKSGDADHAARSDAPLVRVANPLAEDEPYLRAELMGTLARRAEYNLNRMQGNVRLFEVGTAFTPQGKALPKEEMRAAVLVMGARRPPHFTDPHPPAFDEWDAKAIAQLLARAAFPGMETALVPSSDESALWRITIGGVVVGNVTRVALDAPVWASPAFGVEVTLGVMPNATVAGQGANAHGTSSATGTTTGARTAPTRFRSLPTTPAAEFDLALLVPADMLAGQVEAVLRETGGELLERVTLFDEFRGAGVPDGMRSLAWRLTFRHPERTLRDKEIEGRRAQLLKTLEGRLGVRPRTS
ncbi:MAG TPA: phenylalanine--tRNA ligase subunit beta [Gemmatimonadaceae bacterium]|nr:phenylalanine--tRNA ligase subunit beta [Gemmatimonadaceae bacterium]